MSSAISVCHCALSSTSVWRCRCKISVAIVIVASCTFGWRSELKTVCAGGRLAANATFSLLDDVADAGKEHVATHAPNQYPWEDERLGMPFDVAIASVPGSWPSTAPCGRF